MTNLTAIVQDRIGEDLKPSLERTTIAYLFRLISAPTYNNLVKEKYRISGQDASSLRSAFNNSGYVQQSVKPFLFWHWQRDPDESRAVDMARKFGVDDSDMRLIGHMSSAQLAEQMEPLEEYKPYTKRKMQRYLREIPTELQNWCARFVYTKLRFLEDIGMGLTQKDLARDCMVGGIYAFLNTYPRIDNRLHAVNIFKRGIHNTGLKIIEQMTTQKRAHLIKQGDRFVNLIHDKPIEEHNAADTRYVVDDGLLMVTDVSISFLGMEREAVRAMSGFMSPGFSEWIHANAPPHHKMPNDQLFDLIADEEETLESYTDYLMDYMGLHWQQWDRFRNRVINRMDRLDMAGLYL